MGESFQGAYRSGKQQIELVIDLLYRRKWVVLFIFVLAVSATVAYTWTRLPQYQSTSYVMVDLAQRVGSGSTRGSGDGMSMMGGGASSSLFAGARTLSSEIQLLQISDELRQRVRQRFEAMQEQADSLGAEGQPVPQGNVSFDELRGGNNMIQMVGISSQPRDAALLANLYAEEYVRMTKEANQAYVSALRQSLEEREQQRRVELDQIETRLQQYVLEHGAVDLNQGAMQLVMKMATLESQLDQGRIELSMRREALAEVERELQTVDQRALTRMTSGVEERINQLRTELSAEETRRARILIENPDLEATGEDDPRLATINQRIQRLRGEMQELSKRYLDEVGATGGNPDGLAFMVAKRREAEVKRFAVDSLQTQIAQMEKRLGEYEQDMGQVPQQTMEYARLERERVHAEQMYNYIVNQLQQARITEEAEPGYARLLRMAVVPSTPFYPDKPRNIILGVFMGLMLGLGLGIVLDKLDSRIFKPDQVRDKGYPNMGIVPDLRLLIKEDHGGKETLEYQGRTYATGLVTLFNPLSTAAEAYRHVRTNMQHALGDRDVRVILVTSPGPSEGKSLSAANLAIAMAQAGRRTLLVDADMRRPKQHTLMGAPLSPGLMEILKGSVEFSGDMLKTEVDNLHILAAGGQEWVAENGQAKPAMSTALASPGELLDSERMANLLEVMDEAFEVIIIDSPPVLATADPIKLSTLCDVTLVVVRAGQTREAELDQAMQYLSEVDASLAGVLFNGFNLKLAYGMKYKYRHYSKYGPYSKYGYYGYQKKA